MTQVENYKVFLSLMEIQLAMNTIQVDCGQHWYIRMAVVLSMGMMNLTGS